MKNGFSELKGEKVYLRNAETPWGILSDLIIEEKSGKVLAYLVKTLSLVPIAGVLEIKDVKRNNKRLEINKLSDIKKFEEFASDTNSGVVSALKLKRLVISGGASGKLKNMYFDMETGEICDAVIVKNIIAGSQTVLINKISVKYNTIYAEIFKEEE